MTTALEILNAVPRADAIAMVAPLVECSPWVAEAALDGRSFTSDEALAQALVAVILAADSERQRALFRVHPELAGQDAATGRMTAESSSEQGRLGLLSLHPAQIRDLDALNTAYRARFGHPFIIALHRVADLEALFAIFRQRLSASPIEEHATTLAEIASVIRARAARAFGGTAPLPTPVSSLAKG